MGILRLPQDLELLEEHPSGVGCTQSGQIFDIIRSQTASATNPSGFTQLLYTTHSWHLLGFARIYEIESAFGLYLFQIYSLTCHFASRLLDSTACLHKELDVKQIRSIEIVFSEPMQSQSSPPFSLSDNWQLHWKKISRLCSHEPTLNRFSDKYKVSIRMKALPSETILT